jgi:cyclopropane fatty-acyl-phospholipid synthase-like methyltransferase
MNKNVTERSIQSWFDRWYHKKKSRSMRDPDAYPVYLEYLSAGPEDRLLDVGCGPGWLLKAAAERGLETYGFDFSEEAIRLARQNSPASHCAVGDVNHINHPNSFFDCITCIGVLEHFLKMDKAISEMKRVAKKRALFCIMVPNSTTIFWKFSELFSSGHRESNENAKNLPEWISFFEGYQFRIRGIYPDQWNIHKMFIVLGLRHQEGMIRGVKQLVRTMLPLRFSRQFIFILEDKGDKIFGETGNG